MRPTVLRIACLLVLTLGALRTEHSVVDAQDGGGLGSEGLGIARAVWEETHGPGDPVGVPSPVYGELLAYGFDGGMYYAAFEGSKSDADAILMYLEIAFDGGVPSDEARAAVDGLLPSDAEITEPFYLPPSPGALSALSAFRYESAALATVPYGTIRLGSGILVVYVERVEVRRIASEVDASIYHETIVTRVSIAAAIPEG